MTTNNTRIENGVLYFDGCDLTALAEKYGTPLFVYSETELLRRTRELKEQFTEKYPGARVAYTSKAFCTKAMIKLIADEGLDCEVVSGGELAVALAAGMPAERIEMNGNNKSLSEIETAVAAGIGRIIVDGLTELDLIEEACKKTGKKTQVIFRVTPGVAADTHDHIVTGKLDSKFGIPMDEEIFYPLAEKAIRSEYISFLGLHMHIGSQLFDVKPFLEALDALLGMADGIYDRFGVVCSEMNFGGGFGVTYVDEERKDFSYFLDPLAEKLKAHYEAKGWDLPAMVIEPGRSVVAEAGMTLYKVGQIKDIPGVRKYVSIDGGMSDNIRTALYDAKYRVVLAGRADEAPSEKVTVCGCCCESGDIIVSDVMLPAAKTGDVLAVYTTGAYCYAMASNYNNHPVPAVVFVKDGADRLVVKRQTYDQLMENQLL